MIIKKDLSLKENNIHGDFLLPIMKYHCIVPEHFALLLSIGMKKWNLHSYKKELLFITLI